MLAENENDTNDVQHPAQNNSNPYVDSIKDARCLNRVNTKCPFVANSHDKYQLVLL